MSLTLQAMAHARLGNEVEMNAAGAAALATGEDSMNVEIGLWGNAYPVWHLAKGDLTAAAHAFDRAIAALRQLPGGAYPWPGLWALARTVADERGAEARRDVRSLPADTPVSRMMALAADAVAAGREGEPERAEVLFAEADTWLARMEGGFRRAIVRLLAAPAAHEAGWGEPEPWLRESLAVFDRNGLHDFAARCREALRDMHAPVPRRSGGSAVPPELAALGITSREVDVLSLVAGGLSNKEAAERLVISVRTVDKHVERLLMKAGTNRAGLVELADRAGLRT
jgi:ATP/maltotriose-dependent transcriptional regulator MalT